MRRRLHPLAGAVADFLKALTDFFLPDTCVVCGRVLLSKESHLCAYCEADMPLTGYWLREIQPMSERYNACFQEQLDHYEPFQRAAALFFYQEDAGYKHIPQAVKYEARQGLGRSFGRRLGEKLAGSPLFADVDLILPVPLHPWRHFKRGYNQAAVIARALLEAYVSRAEAADSATLGHLCPPLYEEHLVRRVKATRTQTQLSVEQKRKNVSGAFRVDAEVLSRLPFSPRHILLVDDVFTTGATMAALHAALRTVFPPAVRISVAALAFVQE